MDESGVSPMLDGSDFAGRLDEIEARLERWSAMPAPRGLTEADADSGERWEARHVWAHMAEVVGYWHEQFDAVIAEYAGQPVPFGRTKRDPGRLAAIDVGSREPVGELVRRARDSLASFRRRMAGYTSAEWNAVGQHETLGPMDVEAMVERFIVSHLEEHLDQLDGLASGIAEVKGD
jgi:hypothetical protein